MRCQRMIISRTAANSCGGRTTEEVQMKNLNTTTRLQCPAPSRNDLADDPGVSILDEDDDMPGSAYLVMHEGRHMPALQEHLRESGLCAIH
jgi:hypothetical protein